MSARGEVVSQFKWLEITAPSTVREDFLAVSLKAFRTGSTDYDALASQIQADLSAVHGVGWNVVIGKELWRILRPKTVTCAGLKCVDGQHKDVIVLVYKCNDESAGASPPAPAVAVAGGDKASAKSKR